MGQIPVFSPQGVFLGSREVDRHTDMKCRHPNAKVTDGGCSEGCCDDYLCPDCGETFRVECPD